MHPTPEEVQAHIQETLEYNRRLRKIATWTLIPLIVIVPIIEALVWQFLDRCF